MKKISILLVTVLLLLVGCAKENIETLSYKDLNKKLENKESFVLYLDDDSDNLLSSTLNSVLEENNLNGFKLKVNKLSDKEKDELKLVVDYTKAPSIAFIIEGRDPSVLAHVTYEYSTKDTIVNHLKDLGFIKEKTSE